MAKSATSTQSKFNPKKIMIMKKVYIKPGLEIFEVEPAGMMLKASDFNISDERTDDDFEEFSNKRESNAPWNKSPWE